MKPPVCVICDRDLRDGGGDLVEFAKSDGDFEWDRLAEQSGMSGHPPYAEWFCDEHLGWALELQAEGSTLEQALVRLRR